eukprot:s11970_g1.t1
MMNLYGPRGQAVDELQLVPEESQPDGDVLGPAEQAVSDVAPAASEQEAEPVEQPASAKLPSDAIAWSDVAPTASEQEAEPVEQSASAKLPSDAIASHEGSAAQLATTAEPAAVQDQPTAVAEQAEGQAVDEMQLVPEESQPDGDVLGPAEQAVSDVAPTASEQEAEPVEQPASAKLPSDAIASHEGPAAQLATTAEPARGSQH